jgi:CheY-like chemotaxis protein
MLDADVVIHDAQYTPAEYSQKRNWGHSTYEYVVRLAIAARVRKLFLTHHDPTHDDAFLTDIENRARAMVRDAGSDMEVACAREGCSEVILPRLSGERPATASHSDKTLPIDGCGPVIESQRLRVLVVDDDPDMRVLASRVLTKAGYIVSEASGGLEALAILGKNAPDLMLLDISMPDLSGIEVLQILRSKLELAALPVIVLTAYGDEDITRESFAAGATDFVSKPFSPPQLSARVRACFARAATRDTDLQPLQ